MKPSVSRSLAAAFPSRPRALAGTIVGIPSVNATVLAEVTNERRVILAGMVMGLTLSELDNRRDDSPSSSTGVLGYKSNARDGEGKGWESQCGTRMMAKGGMNASQGSRPAAEPELSSLEIKDQDHVDVQA
jgi:hypothetical protein